MEPLAKLCHLTTLEFAMSKLYYQQAKSPFGDMHLYANDSALCALLFKPWDLVSKEQILTQSNPIIEQTLQQISEYFQGDRIAFNVPISANGTEFQTKVWKELVNIPFGKTWSYGELANAIGNPKASRAVGAANGKNPISIIVPCHRVIGANGSLTGYAGGLKAKSWLLQHEKSL
mgnify:CR=1 FL=1